MNILMITKNNIKSKKGLSITLVLLNLISSLFLYIGTNVITKTSSMYDDKQKEINGADISFFFNKSYDINKVIDIVKGNKDIEEVESKNVVVSYSNKIENDKNDLTTNIMFMNADNDLKVSKLKCIDKKIDSKEGAIIVPYIFKSTYGYNVGDTFTIKINNKNYKYKIYSFFEDTLYANQTYSLRTKMYLFTNEYNELKKNLGEESEKYLVEATAKSKDKVEDINNSFIKGINEKLGDDSFSYDYLSSNEMKSSFIILPQIIMYIILSFAVIMIGIIILVIIFSIRNYIDDNIKNIGILKSIGYSDRSIKLIIVLQFILLSAIGIILGFSISKVVTSLFTTIISSSVGLKWVIPFDFKIMILSIVVILSIIILISYLSVRKIKKITPVKAFNNGLSAHSFKKNHINLNNSKMSINAALSLKSIIIYLKQNIMIILITMLLILATLYIAIVNYNFVEKNDILLNLIGIETGDVYVESRVYDSNKLSKELEKHKNVKSVTGMTYGSYVVNDESIAINVCADYNTVKNRIIIEGDYPKNDNEVFLSQMVAKNNNKKVGDTITLTINDKSETYIVTGIAQHIAHLGRSIGMTEEGIKKLDENFKLESFYLCLDKGVDIEEFVKDLKKEYKNEDVEISNNITRLKNFSDTFTNAITLVYYIFTFITVVIISIILILLINIRLSKEKENNGILLSLGYSYKDVRRIILLSIMPIIIIGSILGFIISTASCNYVMSFIMRVCGIYKCNFTINIAKMALLPLIIIIVSFIMSYISTRRVLKLNPREILMQ